MIKRSTLKRTLLISVTVLIVVLAAVNFRVILRFCGYILWLFIPFITSYLVSLLVNPMADGLQKRFHLPRGISAVLVIVLTVGVIGFIISGVVWKIVDEIKGIYDDLPAIISNIRMTWYSISDRLSGLWDNMPEGARITANDLYAQVMDRIGDLAKQTEIVTYAGNFAKKLPKREISLFRKFFIPYRRRTCLCGKGKCFFIQLFPLFLSPKDGKSSAQFSAQKGSAYRWESSGFSSGRFFSEFSKRTAPPDRRALSPQNDFVRHSGIPSSPCLFHILWTAQKILSAV